MQPYTGKLLKSLALGILTWNAPATLANTLHSYQTSGLLAAASQKILFLQENNPTERSIGERYGFTILSDPKNIGIGDAYRRILEQVETEFFLYLENDFFCIEGEQEVLHRLATGIKYLAAGVADCVAYRHRHKPGYPNYAYSFMGQEDNMNGVIYSFHWLNEPEKRFPDNLTRLVDEAGEPWFLGSSLHGRAANYTNNPALYKTSFIRDIINNEVSGKLSEEYEGIISQWEHNRGAPAKSCFLEPNIVIEWRKHDYRIIMGTGLFSHLPLPEERFGNRADLFYLQDWIRNLQVFPTDRGGLPKLNTHVPTTPSAHATHRLTNEQKTLIEILLAHIFEQIQTIYNSTKETQTNCILCIPDQPADLLQKIDYILRQPLPHPCIVLLPIIDHDNLSLIVQRFSKLLPLYACDILTNESLVTVLNEHIPRKFAKTLRMAFTIYLDSYGV